MGQQSRAHCQGLDNRELYAWGFMHTHNHEILRAEKPCSSACSIDEKSLQWNLRIMDTLGASTLVEMYGQYKGRGQTVCPL